MESLFDIKSTSAQRMREGEGVHIRKAVTILRPQEPLYVFWRDLSNLPKFMRHLQSVTVVDSNRSRWKTKSIAGQEIEWDAEIVEDIPNSLISWRSLEGSEVKNSGSVEFRQTFTGEGTEVIVHMHLAPPLGKIGTLIARIFGEDPSTQISEDLVRFKNLMETGTVPTTQGQPSGKRSRREEQYEQEREQTEGTAL